MGTESKPRLTLARQTLILPYTFITKIQHSWTHGEKEAWERTLENHGLCSEAKVYIDNMKVGNSGSPDNLARQKMSRVYKATKRKMQNLTGDRMASSGLGSRWAS